MDYKLEALIVPVADVDRAKEFYQGLGFRLDTDHQPNDDFRIIQFTPPGSECSILMGKGIEQAAPGSLKGLHLVVTDVEAAHAELASKGVEVSDLFHFGEIEREPGPHPDRIDYGSYLAFSDPDGNQWLVQEKGHSR